MMKKVSARKINMLTFLTLISPAGYAPSAAILGYNRPTVFAPASPPASSGWQTLVLRQIGCSAHQELQSERPGKLIGTTSRGLFALLDPHTIVFLSFESYAGPLTANLEPIAPALLAILPTGGVLEVRGGDLYFPEAQIKIESAAAAVWQAPPPPAPLLPRPQQRRNLSELADQLLQLKGEAGFAPLFAPYLHSQGETRLPLASRRLLADLRQLTAALRAPDQPATLDLLLSFLGLGRGLTPSGDDLLCGLLFLRRRAGLSPETWEAPLVAAAVERTTAISAGLLAAAAQGQADERLLHAADYLLAGAPSVSHASQSLAAWGSSSGVDALLGMAIALSDSLDEGVPA